MEEVTKPGVKELQYIQQLREQIERDIVATVRLRENLLSAVAVAYDNSTTLSDPKVIIRFNLNGQDILVEYVVDREDLRGFQDMVERNIAGHIAERVTAEILQKLRVKQAVDKVVTRMSKGWDGILREDR